MKRSLVRLLAGFALATAATAGTVAATPHPATTTQADTAWGTPPAGGTLPVTPPDIDPGPLLHPLDTAWG